MNKILAGLLFFLSASAYAVDTIELPIVRYAAPEAVTVSTSAYTNVTSASTRIADLSAVLIDNPSTNSATMHGHIGNCISTSVSPTIKGPIEIAPSLGGGVIGVAEDQCIWLISRGASAEVVNVQGVRQRR